MSDFTLLNVTDEKQVYHPNGCIAETTEALSSVVNDVRQWSHSGFGYERWVKENRLETKEYIEVYTNNEDNPNIKIFHKRWTVDPDRDGKRVIVSEPVYIYSLTDDEYLNSAYFDKDLIDMFIAQKVKILRGFNDPNENNLDNYVIAKLSCLIEKFHINL